MRDSDLPNIGRSVCWKRRRFAQPTKLKTFQSGRVGKLFADQLCIIWAGEALTPHARHDLMEIIDNQHEHAATTLLANYPHHQWYQPLADAILND